MTTERDLREAAALLRAGGTVIFPTETVYGLGASAVDATAAARIFELKSRPRFNPLIVHAPSAERAFTLGDFPEKARRLALKFWPGPLTLVVPKRDVIVDLVSAGLPTVGLRVPAHPVAHALLTRADLPVAAPSANLFQALSVTRAEDLDPALVAKVGRVLDGGTCRVGLESTIVGFIDEEPVLLRPGGLPIEEIERELGGRLAPAPHSAKPVAPGMLARHYSPRTPLVFAPGAFSRTKGRAGALAFRERVSGAVVTEILSPTGDLREAAAGLFAALKRLDGAGVDAIYAEPFPNQGLGLALNDRLARASNCEEKRT